MQRLIRQFSRATAIAGVILAVAAITRCAFALDAVPPKYEIDQTGTIEPAKPPESKEYPKAEAKEDSLLESIARKVESLSAGTIAGLWRAESASISLADGSLRYFGNSNRPCNLTILKRQFTLRLGNGILADMTYVLNTNRVPWTIDLKSSDGVLLGICSQTDEALKISLNDASKGRPADFDVKTSGMVLVLNRYRPTVLCVINADGSGLRPILSRTDFTFFGSPDWSRDGRRIVFNGWRSLCGEHYTESHVLVCNANGAGFKDLGEGAIPSWSPDGRQIAFSSSWPECNVILMNADGSNRRSLNIRSWGLHWSPTRNELACPTVEGGANLLVFDVAKEQRRLLLDKSYRRIMWGVTWSPDGNWICFKGILPNGNAEIAAVSVQGEKKGFHVLLPASATPEVANCNSTMAWGGSGSQILVAMQKKTDLMKRLYSLDFRGERQPQLFPGYPANWGNADTAWSPDFKKVVIAAKPELKK